MAPGKHIYRATVEKENLHCWQNLDSVICRKIVLRFNQTYKKLQKLEDALGVHRADQVDRANSFKT